MHYEEIARRTIPQIMALLAEAGENISIKIGVPNIFGGAAQYSQNSDQPDSQEEVDSFFGSF